MIPNRIQAESVIPMTCILGMENYGLEIRGFLSFNQMHKSFDKIHPS